MYGLVPTTSGADTCVSVTSVGAMRTAPKSATLASSRPSAVVHSRMLADLTSWWTMGVSGGGGA
jgi:hypothetical protein